MATTIILLLFFQTTDPNHIYSQNDISTCIKYQHLNLFTFDLCAGFYLILLFYLFYYHSIFFHVFNHIHVQLK